MPRAVDISWFDVSRYDVCEQWGPGEWALAIELRNYLKFLTTPEGRSQIDWFAQQAEHGKKIEQRVLTNDEVRTFWDARIRYLHEHIATAPGVVPKGRSFSGVHGVTLGLIGIIHQDLTRDLTPGQLAGYGGGPTPDGWNDYLDRTVEDIYSDRNMSSESWGSNLLLSVQMDVPDDVLVKHFLTRVRAARAKHKVEVLDRTPDDLRLAKWHKSKVLGYFDLCLYKQTQGAPWTDQQIGLALFPGDYGISLDERVRKVIRPLVAKVFTEATVSALQSSQHGR